MMITDPVSIPVVVGVNVTLRAQEAPPLRLEPHVFVCPKSPLRAMEVMLSDEFPMLLTVTVWGALVVPTV
jgi:hypothetical protein